MAAGTTGATVAVRVVDYFIIGVYFNFFTFTKTTISSTISIGSFISLKSLVGCFDPFLLGVRSVLSRRSDDRRASVS